MVIEGAVADSCAVKGDTDERIASFIDDEVALIAGIGCDIEGFEREVDGLGLASISGGSGSTNDFISIGIGTGFDDVGLASFDDEVADLREVVAVIFFLQRIGSGEGSRGGIIDGEIAVWRGGRC